MKLSIGNDFSESLTSDLGTTCRVIDFELSQTMEWKFAPGYKTLGSSREDKWFRPLKTGESGTEG